VANVLKKRIIGIAVCMLVFDIVAILVLVSSTPVRPSEATASETFWNAVYHVDQAVEGTANLSAIHAKPEDHSSAECIACHGVMDAAIPTSGTANVKIDVHFHLKLEVARFSCTDCHRTNRVWNGKMTGSKTAILRTNRFFCFNCHAPFSQAVSASKGNMTMDNETQDCRMCHVGKLAPKHEQPFLSQVLSSTECKMCHADNLFPWPTQHYTAEWTTVHGEHAGDRENCKICHNISIFCHDCHTIKPVTHNSNWRAVHKQLYRTDAQRCATCHTAEWCNTKCHLVSHTADWVQVHSSYVTEHGRDVCMRCHYLGFCMICHNSTAPIKITFDATSTAN
jgi:hypothetical protein